MAGAFQQHYHGGIASLFSLVGRKQVRELKHLIRPTAFGQHVFTMPTGFMRLFSPAFSLAVEVHGFALSIDEPLWVKELNLVTRIGMRRE